METSGSTNLWWGCFVGFEGKQTAKLTMNKSRAPFLGSVHFQAKPYCYPIREITHWAMAVRSSSRKLLTFLSDVSVTIAGYKGSLSVAPTLASSNWGTSLK
jgi:hypothetical protein